MKTSLFKFIFPCLLFISTLNLAQSVNIGFNFDWYGYTEKNFILNDTKLKFVPLSFYLKSAIIFSEKYELELKMGLMFSEELFGPDYVVLFKYGITKNIFPLITYKLFSNRGRTHMSWGIYNHRMDFIGFGVEAKITEVLSLDLIYYIPVGKKDLRYEKEFLTYSSNTYSIIGPMIKLGLIFNIVYF